MGVFDQTFVDGAGKTNRSWAVTVSFLAEIAVVGLMILIPLVWTEVLPRMQFQNTLLAPAPPPPPPSSAPPVTHVARTNLRVFRRGILEAPVTIPKDVAMIMEDTEPLAGLGPVAGAPEGSLLGIAEGVRVLNPPPPATPAKPDAKPADAKPKPQTPLTVGGKVQAAKLIKHPTPGYPSIAKSARIQGTVILQAIIGRDGTVQNLKVVSAASPLLVPSAIDAVKQWVYQPTLLNGEPVEVVTEITVTFALQ